MFREGQQIGFYKLNRILGRGGFGEVWLAERKAKFVTTKVAIKLPHDEQVDHQAIIQEATLWEMASGHPNVLPIIDADEIDGQVLIVSEYAPDGTLADKMKFQGRFSVREAVEMTIGILNGLEFLHSKRIIHRDIKPQNILLQGNTPRLADFGISRAMQTTAVSSAIIGTDAYMSPESFEGKRNVQTDIWSVGVILYQMLKGNLPFSQQNPSERMYAILTKEFEPLPDDVPQGLKNIINKALAKQTQNRYQTAGQMRDWLQSITLVQDTSNFSKINREQPPVRISNGYSKQHETLTSVQGYRNEIETVVRVSPSPATEAHYKQADKRLPLTRFWKNLLKLGEGKTTLHAQMTPAEAPFMEANLGLSMSYYYFVFEDTYRVELRLKGKSSRDLIFNQLFACKKEIEDAFGYFLSWYPSEGRAICRIAYETNFGGYKNESACQTIQSSMIEAMVRLERAVMPYLQQLDRQKYSEDKNNISQISIAKSQDGTKYYRFWENLLQLAKERTTSHNHLSPTNRDGMTVKNVKGLKFQYVINRNDGRVEFYIDRGNTALNKETFDRLLLRKNEIDAVFGRRLFWERLEGRNTCRLGYYFTGGYCSSESKWKMLQVEMIDAMIRLDKAVTPFIPLLLAENNLEQNNLEQNNFVDNKNSLGKGKLEIDEAVIAININQSYRSGMSAVDLYDYTRGIWRLSPERAKNAKYAFAVYQRIIKEVYEIDGWFRAGATKYQNPRFNPEDFKTRFEFTGKVADDRIRDKYVEKLLPDKHSQNPIRYYNC